MLLRTSVSVVLLSGLILVPHYTLAQTSPCPAGSRPAVGNEKERLASLGIQLPGNCIDNTVAGRYLEQNADQSVQFLSQRICPGKSPGLPQSFNANDSSVANWNTIRSNNGYVYFAVGNSGMNPGALRCFHEWFQQMEAEGFQPCVNAAFRSPAHQMASCMAPENSVVCGRSDRGTGPINSCPSNPSAYNNCTHTTGIAMDVNEKTGKLTQLLGRARANPRFTMVGAGAADPWHIEAGGCTDPNFRSSFPPSSSYPPTSAAPFGFGDTARTSLGSSAFGSSLGLGGGFGYGMQPQYQQPYLPPQQPLPPQPLMGAQPITSAFLQPSTSLIPQTQTQTGTSNQITNTNTNTNVNQNTNSATSSPVSVSQQLQQIAFGSGTVATSSSSMATSVPLVITGASAGTLAYVSGQQPGQRSTTTVGGITPTGQNTFMANTMTAQGPNVAFTPAQSTLQQTLSTLVTALRTLLEYLRPFSSARWTADSEGY